MPGGAKYSNYPDTLGPSPYGTDGAKGVSNKTLLKTLFKVPAGFNKDEVAATANAELVPDVLPKNPDPTIWTDPNDIKLGFGGAPDIEAGPFSGQDSALGGPANPYFPNLTSPDPSGAGSIEPIAPTQLKDEDVNIHAQRDVNGLGDPSKLSAEQSNATKITGTTLPLGKHPGAK